ncbi:hypothetical protein ACWGH2_16295 [Streptomyces sp. NPDC054871]
MSDAEEFTLDRLLRRLSTYASALVDAMAALPLPIALPKNPQMELVKELRPAIIRAYEIIDEQPMPEEQIAQATTVLLYWIAASELTVAYALQGGEWRSDAALLNLLAGEDHLADLLSWLSGQQ